MQMDRDRPSKLVIATILVVAVAARRRGDLAGAERRTGIWACSGRLLAFSVFSDLTAIDNDRSLKISGSFLALMVLAMVFLGGTPAALIGVAIDPVRLDALARELRTTSSSTSSPTRPSR